MKKKLIGGFAAGDRFQTLPCVTGSGKTSTTANVIPADNTGLEHGNECRLKRWK